MNQQPQPAYPPTQPPHPARAAMAAAAGAPNPLPPNPPQQQTQSATNPHKRQLDLTLDDLVPVLPEGNEIQELKKQLRTARHLLHYVRGTVHRHLGAKKAKLAHQDDLRLNQNLAECIEIVGPRVEDFFKWYP